MYRHLELNWFDINCFQMYRREINRVVIPFSVHQNKYYLLCTDVKGSMKFSILMNSDMRFYAELVYTL